MTDKIRVRAVAGLFPLIDAEGRTLMGRYCGRAAGPAAEDGTLPAAMPEGELVPNTAYYQRGVLAGSLAIVEEPPVAPRPKAAPPATPTKEIR